ncbi:glycerate kinase [Orrella sp. NBD-18]|uniref:Glycerate kinase n=1 Tax=Sheuella amnicola TaxID=2707330 RepID=A0A6B2R133_9BURK|nr:glycerate kinase [Sheuella amnicola]NDY83778.1 glycerate kinase [Sheuella amnicola]HBI82334.1 glycerate kinase [Alcaligenaceae bacterium]
MKIIIAPDSFKESLSAPEVASAIERGIKSAAPDTHVICIPMADGGEGTVDAVLAATNGERRIERVQNALGEPIDAAWGWLDNETAVIEMAAAAGLEHIRPEMRDPMRATSAGVGELIVHALNAGAKHIVLGLGGSATNDAGAGMLQALGLKLLDGNGKQITQGGAALANLASIDDTLFDERLRNVTVTIASDVNNPLCGDKGASAIFGPQKGATPQQIKQLDAALSHFADLSAKKLGYDKRDAPGSGAAGGLGFAAHAWLQARFRPGIEVVAGIGGLANAVQGASLVITGEGRMDAQTLLGKTPMGVATIAKQAGVPVIAIAGSLGAGYQNLYTAGIQAAFSLTSGPMTLQHACENAAELLEDRTRDIMRLWLAARHHVI